MVLNTGRMKYDERAYLSLRSMDETTCNHPPDRQAAVWSLNQQPDYNNLHSANAEPTHFQPVRVREAREVKE